MKIKFEAGCKVFTDTFDYLNLTEMEEDDIVTWLLTDSGHASDEDGDMMKGDLNIWYLGTNEKHGGITVGEQTWEWGICGACWSNVSEMITALREEGMSIDNCKKLLAAYFEGASNFTTMYDIGDYLRVKENGAEWRGKDDSWRKESMKFFSSAIDGIKEITGTEDVILNGPLGETIKK